MNRLGKRFDARVISLYSRNVQDDAPGGLAEISDDSTRAAQFYSFSYFDVIEVTAVDIQDQYILKSAYKKALERPAKLQAIDGNPQFLLAFMDVTEESETYGYSSEEVRKFWGSETAHPLFFMTLINIAEYTQLEKVLKRIKNDFPKDRHLAYLTFDHCSAVIFYRGDTFDEYAHHIFQLYYTGEIVLADAITIFSFTPDSDGITYTNEHNFRALLKVGIRDYKAADQFYRQIKVPGLRRGWLLERNDIWFYSPRATLRWLKDVREAAVDLVKKNPNEAPWFITYNLTILARMKNIHPSSPPSAIRVDALQEKMKAKYLAFAEEYKQATAKLRMAQDTVWLHWLKESSMLAVSLMKNQLSMDLGICLVPQFLDVFDYAKDLFRSEYLNRNAIEAFQANFATFFSNIAILIDSMNQSNSQFVQVPAFHLTSFEMLPQLMAFYVTIAYRLKDALKDEDDAHYYFTISPKFIKSLGVRSLAIQNVLHRDQWLEMVISEGSLYTVQLTTDTMAHEVSHFVGQYNRNREARKCYEVKYAFHEIIAYILDRLPDRLRERLAGIPYNELVKPGESWHWKNAVPYKMAQLMNAADKFWEIAKDLEPFSLEREIFSNDVLSLNLNMSSLFLQQPILFRCIAEHVFQIAFWDNQSKSGRLDLMTPMRRWSGLEYKTGGQKADLPEQRILGEGSDRLEEAIIKSEVDQIVADLLSEHAENIRRSQCEGVYSAEYHTFEKMQYMFSEAFADLQAVMLFQLTWRQYCAMLRREEDVELIKDLPPRMLAVARALLPDIWKDDPIDSGQAEMAAIELVLSKDRDPVKSPSYFQGLSISADDNERTNIEVGLLYYLTEYLKCCKIKIESAFKNNEHVKELRRIHKALSDDSSILKLQQMLMEFIYNYRKDLCKP